MLAGRTRRNHFGSPIPDKLPDIICGEWLIGLDFCEWIEKGLDRYTFAAAVALPESELRGTRIVAAVSLHDQFPPGVMCRSNPSVGTVRKSRRSENVIPCFDPASDINMMTLAINFMTLISPCHLGHCLKQTYLAQ